MKTVPLRRVVASVTNGAWGADSGIDEVDVHCIRAADFNFDLLRVEPGLVPTRSVDQRTFVRLRLVPGDIVLEKSGGGDYAPVGRAVRYMEPADAITSNFAARVRAADSTDPMFLSYVLASIYHSNLVLPCIKQTTGIQNLDTDAWLSIPVPAPPKVEQRRIADFLDDRVSRIDNVIAARHQQIDLSHERFDSAWGFEAEAVGGTVPTVPIRRFLDSIVDGPFGSALTSSHYADRGTRVIRLGNLGINDFRNSDAAYISDDYASSLRQHAVVPGDLLVAGLGDERWPLGRACVAPADLGTAIVKADCYRLRLDGRISHPFAAWYLSSPPSRASFSLLSRGSTRARLNTAVVREARVPFASRQTQNAIVAQFSRDRAVATGEIAALARSITLLTEYKKSLITAAVSGEFDITTASTELA